MELPNKSLSGRHYAVRSLLHYWRVNLAVLIGVVAGTAVLTGALVVGDSVRASLRRLTIERLGKIDEILIADHFFSMEVLNRLRSDQQAISGFSLAEPVILFPQISVDHPTDERTHRSPNVTVLGCDPSFWELGRSNAQPAAHPSGRQIVLNQPLADRLKASVGDRVILRLPVPGEIAADSTLADRSEMTRSLAELEVVGIIPAEGLGRFSLQATQATPLCAYLSLETLQQSLDEEGNINAILIGGSDADQAPTEDQVRQLLAGIRPSLEDASLNLKHVERTFWDEDEDKAKNAYEYFSLSTNRMVFADETTAALLEALQPLAAQPVITYLANSIARGDQPESATGIPYSTVSAVDSNEQLGPMLTDDGNVVGPLKDDEIVLNSWAAKDLNVTPGDEIRISYFKPETTHGDPEEATVSFRLRDVVTLTAPLLAYERDTPARYVSPPTRANDPDLTPQVPGITDQESIDDWDPPFPFSYGRIRNPEDEDYWDNYRTTPKAFIAPTRGREIWGSRFGTTTSLRIPQREDVTADSLRKLLEDVVHENLNLFGFTLLHVKADGLRASAGTTPFNMLFLGFSFFIIAAALMLVALLARLGVEQRGENAGLLLAVGLGRNDVIRLFLMESALLAIIGSVVGGVLGIGYAGLMLYGLQTWWVDAIGTRFLQLTIGSVSLISGIIVGVLASLGTIAWTVIGLRRIAIGRLLNGEVSEPSSVGRHRGVLRFLPPVLFILAVVLAVAATFLGGEAQAGAFFGSGASVLLATLMLTARLLRHRGESSDTDEMNWGLQRFVMRNMARNPGRSTLTIGLMAAACFLIVAISAFRLSPTDEGTGGFDLLAQSDLPVFDDLSQPEVRRDVMGTASDDIENLTVLPFRLQDGDDASCRNLYQSSRPRVIGFSRRAVDHFDDNPVGFAWAATAASSDIQRQNPWHLLDEDRGEAIPVVLDKNTAMYSLHLYGGVGERFQIDYGPAETVEFEVVGLLANSVLQGSLIVSEERLLQQFPRIGGYRFFLIDCQSSDCERVRQLFEDTYSDQGLLASNTIGILEDLLAVQNTYLSTFQSLGGLGLLLGTFGLAAVQLRNVFERRYELALLRATGFAPSRVATVVLAEHLLLLIGGLSVGLLAALVAVLPHSWSGGARPPWLTLVLVLLMIVLVGSATGAFAVMRAVKSPVLDALRGK